PLAGHDVVAPTRGDRDERDAGQGLPPDTATELSVVEVVALDVGVGARLRRHRSTLPLSPPPPRRVPPDGSEGLDVRPARAERPGGQLLVQCAVGPGPVDVANKVV